MQQQFSPNKQTECIEIKNINIFCGRGSAALNRAVHEWLWQGVQRVPYPEAYVSARAVVEMAFDIANAVKNNSKQCYNIYTHSEHVIQAIRISVKEGIIQPKQVQIIFFTDEKETNFTYDYELIKFDLQGELSQYPPGFMEESGKLAARLMF